MKANKAAGKKVAESPRKRGENSKQRRGRKLFRVRASCLRIQERQLWGQVVRRNKKIGSLDNEVTFNYYDYMQTKTIGIREMKAHLSGYLRDVKRGEELLISERGKAIARLVPAGAPAEAGKLHSALVKMALAGAIILPPSYKPPRRPKFRKKVKGSLFSKAIIEDRR